MTSSKVLSGLDTAATVYESFNDRVKVLSTKGVVPGLCVVLVGEDPASKIYVRTKSKKLRSLGLVSETIRLDADVTEQKLLSIIGGIYFISIFCLSFFLSKDLVLFYKILTLLLGFGIVISFKIPLIFFLSPGLNIFLEIPPPLAVLGISTIYFPAIEIKVLKAAPF